MKTHLLLLFSCIALLSGQVTRIPSEPWWTAVGSGPLANRPTGCTVNRDVYVCNGTGCGTNGEYHYCTAGNTWTVASGATAGGIQSGSYLYCASAVGTDSYACNLVPPIVAYTTGMVVNLKTDVANTGACSLALNGLAAKAIKRGHDVDPADGEIEANQVVTLAYDGTNFEMQSQTGLGGGAIGGFENLPAASVIPRVSAPGVLGPSGFSDDGTKIYSTALRTYGFGTFGRTGNTEPGTTKAVYWGHDLVVANPATLGSESLADGTFTVPTWTRTGDFTVNTGAAVYTHASGVGTFTQLNASMAIAMASGKWYSVVGDVSTTGTAPVCVLTSATADTSGGLLATLRTATGVGVELLQFKSAAAPTGYVTSCTSAAAGTVTYDNLVLKEIQGGDLTLSGNLYARGGTIYGGSGPTLLTVKTGLAQIFGGAVQEWTGPTGTVGLRASYLNGYSFTLTWAPGQPYGPVIGYGSVWLGSGGSVNIGSTYLHESAPGIFAIDGSTAGKWAGLKLGVLSLQSLATPGPTTVTPTCVPGVCNLTWSYTVEAVMADGVATTVPGAVGTTALQNGTLDAANYNTLTVAVVTGATSYKWRRTVSGGTPATLGVIGTTTAATLVDNGLAGDGSAAPTANTTGQLSVGTGGILFATDGVGSIGASATGRPYTITASYYVRAPYFTVTTGDLGWDGKSQLTSPVDGYFKVSNVATADFLCFQLGGVTNAYGAVCRDGTGVKIRVASNDDYGPLLSGIHNIGYTGMAHGMTGLMPTDVHFRVESANAASGGAYVTGASATNADSGLIVKGVIGSTDPTDNVPAIKLLGAKKNTTADQALGAAETVLQVLNFTTPLVSTLGSGATTFVSTVSAAPGGTISAWKNYTTVYTNDAFKVASTTATVTLFQLPANGTIENIRQKHSVAFAGTGITAVTCSVGDGTTADAYAPSFDVFQAVSDTAQNWDGGAYSTTAAAHNVVLTCVANTNFGNGSATVLTAGSLSTHVGWAVLP